MKRTIRVGLVGCGVVGTGILRLLEDNAETIEGRLGAKLEVVIIAARSAERERDPIVPTERLVFDAFAVAEHADVEIVLEVMGGVEQAGEVVRRALESGKHVVTANKALIAERGDVLIPLAEERGLDLYFEAAVAGGIPIIRVLREALAADRILCLRGILNGTSNYILTRMQRDGLGFDEALRLAQEAGYAEADPTLDVSGGDARHKLAILATLAFGAQVDPEHIPMQGIDNVTSLDCRFAERFGFVLRPLAIAKPTEDGALSLRVHPALLPARSVLAGVSGALNAVAIEGAMSGPAMITGLGAGAMPTAMSVVSDLVDVGRNLLAGAHGRVPSRAFRGQPSVRSVEQAGALRSRYYLRFSVKDRPGVLARIAGVLGAFEVSIEQMLQDGGDEETPAQVVILTHVAREADVIAALSEVDRLRHVLAPTMLLRIEDL